MSGPGASRANLLLFTGVFPYGSGEAFLEPEIRHLAAAFEQITVVPRHASGKLRDLPPNVSVDDSLAELHRPRGRRNRPRALALCMGSRHLYSELVRRPITLLQPAAADHLLGHLAAALRTAAWMEQRIADGRLDTRRTVCYCYWLWVEAVGAGVVRQRHPELRLVARAHGFDVYPERHKPPYIALQHFAIRSADNVFPVSEHGRASLAARHPREAPKLEVMRLGTVMPAGCSVSSADGVLRVLTCSRLEEVKRVGLAVRALGAFAERWPELPVEWTHIGDGAERESIENAAERLLPESVKWVIRGELPNASVREHYLESPVDVLLNVSSSEGVPVSMMEALSFGVPVVGTSVGGVPEIIDANTGILLPPDPTAEQIAEALHHFTERSTSVKRMRRAAREQWRTRFDGDRNFTEFVHRLLEAAPN